MELRPEWPRRGSRTVAAPVPHREHLPWPRGAERLLQGRQPRACGHRVPCVAQLLVRHARELRRRVRGQLQPRRLRLPEVGHGALQRLDGLRRPEEDERVPAEVAEHRELQKLCAELFGLEKLSS